MMVGEGTRGVGEGVSEGEGEGANNGAAELPADAGVSGGERGTVGEGDVVTATNLLDEHAPTVSASQATENAVLRFTTA